MTSVYSVIPDTKAVFVVTGATPIHHLATEDEGEANAFASRLRQLGFIVRIDKILNMQLIGPLLLSAPAITPET